MIPIGMLGAATPRSSESASDPYWSSVVSLLNFEGADGSTTFVDATGHAWTPTGNAQIDTSLGYSAGRFDGSASTSISTPDSDDWDFGTGDFTVEQIVRFNSLPTSGAATLITNYGGVSAGWGLQFRNDAGLGARISFARNGDSGVNYKAWSPSTGQDYHVAASRVGGILYLCADGLVLDSFSAPGSVAASSAALRISGLISGSLIQRPDCWTRMSRVTKGVGRYDSSYSPPTPPLPTS